MDVFIERHSGELLILILAAMLFAALLVLVPQLLRSHHRGRELQHEENLRALEQGHKLPAVDPAAWAAGRTATLVPIVAVVAACIVTCFLVSFKSENIFSVALTVWCVAGVLGFAAITGGVALMGRQAQLHAGDTPTEEEETPVKEQQRMTRG